MLWPYRLTVRTSAFQAGNRGSIPRGATKTSERHAVAIDRFSYSGNRTGATHREHPGPQGIPRGATKLADTALVVADNLRLGESKGGSKPNEMQANAAGCDH